MTTTDPWTWDVQDVQAFVHNYLPKFASTLPKAKLPDLDALATQFAEAEIDGPALLELVDATTLRDEFAIKSFAQRFCVLGAIAAARKSSNGHKSYKNDDSPQIGLIPTVAQRSCQTAPLEDGQLGPRQNETFVEDSTGRKRRRLTLTPFSNGITADEADVEPPASPKPTQLPGVIIMAAGYLRETALSLDHIFYGDIPLGEPIPDEDDAEQDQDDEINFVADHTRPTGDVQYVHALLRHLSQTQQARLVRYQGRDTWALFPYRKQILRAGVRPSAIVFPEPSHDSLAVRADTGLLQQLEHDTDTEDEPQDDNELLLLKHPVNTDENDVVPLWDPDNESDLEIDSDLEAELERDEQAAADARMDGFLTREEIRSIIDEEIDELGAVWRDKNLARLEANSAYTTWRKAKNSRKLRDRLIREHMQNVARLSGRLEDLAHRILGEQWKNVRKLRDLCVSFEPTVSEMGMLKWELDVWNRKVAPTRQIRSRDHQPGDKAETTNGSKDVDDSVLKDPEDATSEHDPNDEIEQQSPAPMRIDLPFVLDPEGQSSPVVSPMLHADPIDFDNDDQALSEHDDHGPATPTPEDEALDSPFTRPDTPQAQDEGELKAIRSPTSSPLPLADDIASHHRLPPSTDRKRKRSSIAVTPPEGTLIIEISSDNDSPVKAKKATLTHPDKAGPSDFDSWSWEELEITNDRQRFMLKLLYSLGRTILEQLRESIVKIRHKQLPDKLMDFLNRFDQSKLKPEHRDMLSWAKLYACWQQISPQFWNRLFELQTVEDRQRIDMQVWISYVFNALPRLIDLLSKDTPEVDGDGDTSDGPVVTPRKKRIKTDQNAVKQRADANARLKRHMLQQSFTDGALGQLVSPDGHTEIVVNIGKSDDEAPILLHSHLAARLKPHQIEGLQFLWRETISTGEEGCLLAHAMGLGKTAQAISLLVTIAEAMRSKETRKQVPRDIRMIKALILVPPSLIANWNSEINQWSPHSGYFNTYICDTSVPKEQRLDLFQQWDEAGGILIIGHALFASILKPLLGGAVDDRVKSLAELLLDKPNIVIADEAHCFKTESAQISKLVHRITTRRRVALTGSPLSNNTLELYALVSWVSPNFLGPSAEFRQHYANPIEEGLYTDSAPGTYRKSLRRLAALRKVTEPKVHRLDIDVLRDSLPSKTEFVLFVSLTELQSNIYSQYMALARGACEREGTDTIPQIRLFGWLAVLKLLCNHPQAFRTRLESWLAAKDKPKNKSQLRKLEKPKGGGSGANSPLLGGDDEADEDEVEESAITDLGISEGGVQQMISSISSTMDTADSYKVLIAQQIIQQCRKVGDKILFFSQSLPTLDLFEEILDGMRVTWDRIDGTKSMKHRNQVLRHLRHDRIDVVLISTRAGGLGLNIQDANRVIIFDFSFNPQWEAQAIGRAYRLGQRKACFIYRFVAGGTFESKLYNQGLFKTSVAARVLDSKNPARNAKRKKVGEWLIDPEPVPSEDISVEKGRDTVMDRIIDKQPDDPYIRDIKTMETLNKEVVDAEFNVEEQREVDDLVAHSTARASGAPLQPVRVMPDAPISLPIEAIDYLVPMAPLMQSQAPPQSLASMAGFISGAQDYLTNLIRPPSTAPANSVGSAGERSRSRPKEFKPAGPVGVERANGTLGNIFPGHRSTFGQRSSGV